MPDLHIDIIAQAAGKAWAKTAAGWWPFGKQQAPAQTPKPIAPPATAPMAPPAAVAAPKLLEPPRVALSDGIYRPPQGSPAPAPIKVPAVPGQNMFDQVGRLNAGAGRWINRMYSPGAIPRTVDYADASQIKETAQEPYARGAAHSLIQEHVARNNAELAYRQDLAQRFKTLGAQPRTAYSLENIQQLYGASKPDNVATDPTGVWTDPRHNPFADKQPDDLVTTRMQVSSPTRSALTGPLFGIAPINFMDPNLTGLHELQHVNQSAMVHELPSRKAISRFETDPILGPNDFEAGGGPPTFQETRMHPNGYAAEPAAVLTELVHGADAARNATGAPVEGQVALTPQYQPKLDWMRQQAQQHNVLSGESTVQDQLNTPAGQAWMRMQYDQLAPAQGHIYDQYMKGNARKLQNAVKVHGAGLPEYMRQDLPKYLTKQNSALDIIAQAAGKAWAKQADLLPTHPANAFIAQAELMGSRGRALMYGRPEPADKDHDYIAFTDDPAQQANIRKQLETLIAQHGYTRKDRPGGFFTASGNNMDLSYYPTAKRNAIHKAWALQEGGMSKDDAWAQVERKKQADLLPGIQLQDHQQRISDRVTGENPRMLVYHGLGSGKSLSALAAAEAAQKLDGGSYGIVAPASLKNNFQKEIKKFTTGSTPEVMSYTGLGMGKQFQDQPETLIIDEAARLRNPNSAMTRAAVQAAAQAKRVMLLTGTPITNEPKDLASLISLLQGKQLSPEEFDKQYVGEETVRPGWRGWLSGAKAGVRPVMKNSPALRKLLEGHVDYQPSKTPEGVDVNEQTIRVPLSSEQDKIQKAIRTKVPPGFLWKLDHEFPLSRDELAKLNSFMTGFRQVGLSTQPFRADKSPLKAFQQSSKMQAAFKNLQTTLDSDPRKKAIIYSNFVDAGLNPYSAGLTQAGISHGMFTGSESVKNRQAAVDAYNQNKLRALLIGPAGAEGISTKGTSLIQLMDPHWNEARSQQAQGRGLRFDSHTDLPEELKNVAVQRYLSSSEDPSYLGKLMGYKRERTGDEVLSRLTAEKERLNEQFRQILRDAGTKTSAVGICPVSREQLKSASNPRVKNFITTGPAMSSLENMSIAEKCAHITKAVDEKAAYVPLKYPYDANLHKMLAANEMQRHNAPMTPETLVALTAYLRGAHKTPENRMIKARPILPARQQPDNLDAIETLMELEGVAPKGKNDKQANYAALEDIAGRALLGGGAGAAVGGLGGAIMGGKGNRIRGALRGAGAGGLIGAGAGAGYGFMGTIDPYQLHDAAADNAYTNKSFNDLQQKLDARVFGTDQADSDLFNRLSQLRDAATRNIRMLPRQLAEERAPTGALAGGLLGLGGAAGAGLLSNKKKKDKDDEKAAQLRNFGAMIANGYSPTAAAQRQEQSKKEARLSHPGLDMAALGVTTGGLGAMGGGLAGLVGGGLHGAISPGNAATYDDQGNVTGQKRRNRLMGALRGGLGYGALGAAGGAAVGGLGGAALEKVRPNTYRGLVGDNLWGSLHAAKELSDRMDDVREYAKRFGPPAIPTP